MTSLSSKIISFLIIFIVILSCKGQDSTLKKEIPIKINSKGTSVENISESIWSIFQDHKNNYWFGSNGAGVFCYDGKSIIQFTKDNGLIDDSIRGIQGDQHDNVYIETPKGVSKYDGNEFSNLNPIVSSMNDWKLTPNDLWFNCNGSPNDVYRYDGNSLFELSLPRKDLYEAFGTLVNGLSFKGMNSSPYSVFGIDKDRKGNLWIGTIVAGAYRYDGESFLWVAEKELSTLPDGRVPGVRSMIEDKDGNMWLSNFISKYKINTTDSLVSYEKLRGIDIEKGHFVDRIPYFNSGLTDKHGNLWMTTYTGGAWKYDGKHLINFPVMNNKAEVLLISIYEDKNGELWLGTDNAGVYKFNGISFKKYKF